MHKYLRERKHQDRMRDMRKRGFPTNERDYRDYKDYKDYSDYRDFKDYMDYKKRSHRDYPQGPLVQDEDYADDDEDEREYKEDLKDWIRKLKSKDRFSMPIDTIIQKANGLGARFGEYSEDEFYAIYLMMVSDYKDISNDPNIYIRMAKDFLEDDDVQVSPADKVCIYMYKIVNGE